MGGGVHIPRCTCGGQRTSMWSHFSPYILTRVPNGWTWDAGLYSKYLNWVSSWRLLSWTAQNLLPLGLTQASDQSALNPSRGLGCHSRPGLDTLCQTTRFWFGFPDSLAGAFFICKEGGFRWLLWFYQDGWGLLPYDFLTLPSLISIALDRCMDLHMAYT